jgi:hypothetical protein
MPYFATLGGGVTALRPREIDRFRDVPGPGRLSRPAAWLSIFH